MARYVINVSSRIDPRTDIWAVVVTDASTPGGDTVGSAKSFADVVDLIRRYRDADMCFRDGALAEMMDAGVGPDVD